MDSRWLLLVLLVLAGCGPKACGRALPASPASAPDAATAPAAVAPPSAPAPPEARLAGQNLVIVHSSSIPGEGEPLLEKLRAAGLGVDARRLSSTPFASLRPCLELVVAGAFADRDAALALAQRLDAAGVSNYLKNAGPLAKDRERREAECREQAQALKAPARMEASAPRFLDLRGERTFVLLSHAPGDTAGTQLRQVGEDRGFWMAALEADPTGTFKKGDAFAVYDAQGPIQLGCRVKGFAWLNRGIAHFGYFQQPEPPTGPGCGRAWPVAELDCSLTNTRVRETNLAFVLPKGSPAPRYLPAQPLQEPLRTAQERALHALSEYAKARAEGQAHAQQQGLPLRESLDLKAFSLVGRQVVVALSRLQTGEGRGCGGKDYRASVSRVVALGADGQEASVAVVGDLDSERLLAVMDLEGDGKVELLTRGRVDPSQAALIREDGTPLVLSFLPHCDTGC
jgi:hypothetical protein